MKALSPIFCALLLSYCRPGDAPPPASPLAESAYVKAPAGLNMREQASQSARVLVLIPFRAKVTVISRAPDRETIGGESGKWAIVTYSGQSNCA
jgi:hypothetical protein